MSFGFGVGDFIAVGQLTLTVYRSCKGAPGEFQELASELSSLHMILLNLEEDAKSPNSLLNRRGAGRKSQLMKLLENVQGVLKEIEDIVERYQSLGRDQKKTWDRVAFASKNLADLRSKLKIHIGLINEFNSSLLTGSLARIEGVLDDLVRDIKSGKKEPTVISSHEEDDLAWSEVKRELVGEGITIDDVEKYKNEIRVYLKGLIGEDLSIDVDSSSSLAAGMDDLQFSERASTALSFNSERDSNRESSKKGKSKVYIDDKNASKRKSNRKETEASDSKRKDEGRRRSARRKHTHPPPEIRTASLKDLLKSSATSSKPIRAIRTDVMSVLKKLGVHFTESKDGGFHCKCQLWVRDYDEDNIKVIDIRNAKEVLVITDGQGKHWREADEEEKFNTAPDGLFAEALARSVKFGLFIVKVPLRSKHRVRFELQEYERIWTYDYVTETISEELRVLWAK